MTEETQPRVLNFNDKEYEIDNLSEKAQYLVGQLQDIGAQTSAQRARLDQLEAARSTFAKMLEEELEAPTEEPQAEG